MGLLLKKKIKFLYYMSKIGIFSRSYEEPNILEWIDYHFNLGFDYIFIYDDIDDENKKISNNEFLKKNNFYDDHLILFKNDINIPEKFNLKKDFLNSSMFFVIMINKIRDMKLDLGYLLNMDIDEYLFIKDHNNISDFITSNDFNNVDYMYIPWLFFGNSGRMKFDGNKYLPNFTYSSVELRPFGKSLFKFNDNLKSSNCHNPFFYKENKILDFYGNKHDNFTKLKESLSNQNLHYKNANIYLAHYHNIGTKNSFDRRFYPNSHYICRFLRQNEYKNPKEFLKFYEELYNKNYDKWIEHLHYEEFDPLEKLFNSYESDMAIKCIFNPLKHFFSLTGLSVCNNLNNDLLDLYKKNKQKKFQSKNSSK